MRQIIVIPLFICNFLFVLGNFSSYSAPKSLVDNIVNSKNQRILEEKIEVNQLNEIAYTLEDKSIQLSYSSATKALKIAKEINYKRGIAQAYFIIANYYESNGVFLPAIKFALLSYDLSKEIGDYKLLSQSLNQIGSINHPIKRNDRAVRFYSLALQAAQKVHDTNQIINIYINYSEVYSDSNKFEIVKKYLFNSLYLCLKQHNQQQEAGLYRHLGIFYLRQHDYNTALYYFRESIRLVTKLNQVFHVGSLYTLIAHTYEQQKDFLSELKYNELALTYRLSNNRDEQVASSYLNIGHTYLLMDQLDSALYYLNEGIAKVALFNFRKNNLLKTGYENLYLLYQKKNNIAATLECYKKYSLFEDSVIDEKNKVIIFALETNYLLNETEKETLLLKNENFIQKLEMKNRDLVISLFIALFLLTIAIAVYVQQLLVKNKKAKKVVEEKNDQLHDEIKEQVIQNEELAKREEEYRFLADHTADLVTLMDSNFKCLYISPSSEMLLGYSPEELMGMKDYRELIHPDSRKSFDVEFESMMEYHEATRFLYQAIKKDGTTLWVESNINPIFKHITGKLQAMLSITRDVSGQIDQEQALMETARQKDMLIREVHHRVKNNLAILTSLVNMQKSEFTDHKTLDIFSDLQFRVKAMALVHEELYKSRNIEVMPVGEYLSKLVRDCFLCFY